MRCFARNEPAPIARQFHSFRRCILLSAARIESGTLCNIGAASVNPAFAKFLKSRYKILHVKVDDQRLRAAAAPSENSPFRFAVA